MGQGDSPGTMRKNWFDREEEAVIAGEKLREAKQKKRYRLIFDEYLGSLIHGLNN